MSSKSRSMGAGVRASSSIYKEMRMWRMAALYGWAAALAMVGAMILVYAGGQL